MGAPADPAYPPLIASSRALETFFSFIFYMQLKELVSDLCLPKTDCDNYMSGKESVGHFDFEERNTMNQVAMICLALGYNIVALTVLTVKMWCKRR